MIFFSDIFSVIPPSPIFHLISPKRVHIEVISYENNRPKHSLKQMLVVSYIRV